MVIYQPFGCIKFDEIKVFGLKGFLISFYKIINNPLNISCNIVETFHQ